MLLNDYSGVSMCICSTHVALCASGRDRADDLLYYPQGINKKEEAGKVSSGDLFNHVKIFFHSLKSGTP